MAILVKTWREQVDAITGDYARWEWPLSNAATEFSIDTFDRVSMWLGQVAHESGGFRYLREIWGPTQAQRGYEGRADLGNTEEGDGFRFRGRGLIQITGRTNYQECGDALGLDLIAQPELLEQPDNAARSAGWFWASHGCNQLADAGNYKAVTRRINGGLNGQADREMWLAKVREALS